MVMKEFVKAFPEHIDEAIKIADTIDININKNNIDNIVIGGQGGSAIGGLIVKNLFILVKKLDGGWSFSISILVILNMG